MGLINTIRQHAAMASGNFTVILKDAEIPPLPAAVSRLLSEINRTDPNVDLLGKMISADPEIAAKVLRTVNSPLFALKNPVQNIVHAISLLGLERIRTLVLSYTMLKTLPEPEIVLFDHEAYWTDSLLHAFLAQHLCREVHHGQEESAFTASLLADLALPVLLAGWHRYYEPVITAWLDTTQRLSEIEQQDFGWNHAQAGGWILQEWEFPAEMVCLAATHNLNPQQLQEMDLADTAAMPVSIASLLPSVLKPDPDRCRLLLKTGTAELSLEPDAWLSVLDQVLEDFVAVCQQFGLSPSRAERVLDLLAEVAGKAEPNHDSLDEP